MAATLAEKLVARAVGTPAVIPGEVVTARVDLAMIHDSGGPRRVAPILKELGVGLFDRDRVVLIADHYVPGDTLEGERILQFTRDWAQEQRVAFHDGQGICHVVLPEQGHLSPGMFVVGGDSHSCTGGAFGAFAFGVGATDMAGVLATGEIWLQVPETIQLEWSGTLQDGVFAKDMMLHLCGVLGMDGGQYQAVEYLGEAVRQLPMQERMTLSNMAAELGAQVGIIAPDEITWRWLASTGATFERDLDLHTDASATVLAHHVFDASALSPQVAAPHSPANAMAIEDVPTTSVDVAYIGACTGAKYHDMAAAARVLRHQQVNQRVQLLLAPASQHDLARARDDGTLAVLESAGASVLPTACGICAGYGAHRLGEDITCISSTARNFQGRMGAASAEVWLASPMTVAASAIEGRICDPRAHLRCENGDLA